MRVGEMMLQPSPPRSSEPQPAKAGPHPRIKLSARECAFSWVCLLARVCTLAGGGAFSRECAFACLYPLARVRFHVLVFSRVSAILALRTFPFPYPCALIEQELLF